MIQNLFGDDEDDAARPPEAVNAPKRRAPHVQGLFDTELGFDDANSGREDFVISTTEPETFAETARRSGLAWSAGIVFFASVAFMLVLGWGADLLLGTSPWGMVGGIILGSLIGFVQFFRLTSQIFEK